ncbi:MAG: PAS domain-containing sensor histidine kinase [Ignavibacteriales bacterium]|nr:PAS domain-containing sensor histidine kinase [Ignavibacteriales bacterium]
MSFIVDDIEILKSKIELLETQFKDLEFSNIAISNELKKYKIIFDGSLDVVMITDGKAGKILDISKSSKILLGYNPQELIGKHYSVLLPEPINQFPEKKLNDLEIFGSVLAARKVLKKDGAFCNMDLTINIIEWGNEKAVCTNFRDITERLKHEEEIQKFSDELGELNASKDKFFSIIAHDLKSPFTGLLGFSQMLNEEFNSLTTDELRNYSREIHNSANAIFKLLNNLLQWSWISIGKQSFNPCKINITELIHEVINLLSPNAAAKNINIIFRYKDTFYIYADETMIHSIIQNLLSNAIKFTPRDGKITISLSKALDKVVISIKDTGVGIQEKDITNLFKLDKHLSTLGTDKEKGTGLGLLIVKELVEKNGGAIEAKSKINEGATFRISLPKFA